jgi:hypothetical protein
MCARVVIVAYEPYILGGILRPRENFTFAPPTHMYLVPCIVRHRYSWIIRFEGMPYAGSSLPLTVYVNDVGLTGTNPSGSTTTSPEVQSLAVAAVVTGFTVSFMGQTSTSQVRLPFTVELGKGQYRTPLPKR